MYRKAVLFFSYAVDEDYVFITAYFLYLFSGCSVEFTTLGHRIRVEIVGIAFHG